MITEDQAEVVAFLTAASTHGGAEVERVDTHASIVFLAGRDAWKLKRAVRYDYLDFSTLARRQTMCEAELRLNRRTAPGIYRAIVPVTREQDGRLALSGKGAAVEWLLAMRRFDQECLFDRLAARGALDLPLMAPLATAIARLHAQAQRRPDHGGAAGTTWVVDGNARGFAEHGAGVLDETDCARLTDEARAEVARHATRLDDRRARGFVRFCHGDLHLRNIVLFEGVPTLFDGIEFNDELACIDVHYDLAFLLMDLWRRGLPQHANAVLNAYLSDTMDFGGIPLLPLFLSCRAAVRAKTSATAATLEPDDRRKSELQDLSRSYLSLARQLLQPVPPVLMAIGGRSGSGKSTLAYALAPAIGGAPGAVVIRSDEIRKRLCGVDPLDRLGPESYAPDVSSRVYASVGERLAIVGACRHAAIADAVFGRPEDRDAIERHAASVGQRLLGLWLDAPEPVLVARAERREHDASDADAAIVRQQFAQDTGPVEWHHIDASGSPTQVLERALAVVRAHAASAAPRTALPAG